MRDLPRRQGDPLPFVPGPGRGRQERRVGAGRRRYSGPLGPHGRPPTSNSRTLSFPISISSARSFRMTALAITTLPIASAPIADTAMARGPMPMGRGRAAPRPGLPPPGLRSPAVLRCMTSPPLSLLRLVAPIGDNQVCRDRQPGRHPLPRARLRLLEQPRHRGHDGHVRTDAEVDLSNFLPTRTCCAAGSRSAPTTTGCGTRGPAPAGSPASG